jgi:hypothetical protein
MQVPIAPHGAHVPLYREGTPLRTARDRDETHRL